MLRRGQRATITGRAGTVRAEVIHVEIPDRLPVVTSAEELEQVKQIMAERGIVQLAMLSYTATGQIDTTSGGRAVRVAPGQQITFAALENAAGEWHDLQGQRLTIVQEEEPCPDDPETKD